MDAHFAADVVNTSGYLVVIAAVVCVAMAAFIVGWAMLDGTD